MTQQGGAAASPRSPSQSLVEFGSWRPVPAHSRAKIGAEFGSWCRRACNSRPKTGAGAPRDAQGLMCQGRGSVPGHEAAIPGRTSPCLARFWDAGAPHPDPGRSPAGGRLPHSLSVISACPALHHHSWELRKDQEVPEGSGCSRICLCRVFLGTELPGNASEPLLLQLLSAQRWDELRVRRAPAQDRPNSPRCFENSHPIPLFPPCRGCSISRGVGRALPRPRAALGAVRAEPR